VTARRLASAGNAELRPVTHERLLGDRYKPPQLSARCVERSLFVVARVAMQEWSALLVDEAQEELVAVQFPKCRFELRGTNDLASEHPPIPEVPPDCRFCCATTCEIGEFLDVVRDRVPVVSEPLNVVALILCDRAASHSSLILGSPSAEQPRR